MGKIFNKGLFSNGGGGGGGASWGSITGTLSNQTDLQSALNNKQDSLVSGTNIKTVNGNTLLGSGNVAVRTYQEFNTTGQGAWRTNSTIANFCYDVDNDSSTVEGMAYLGGLTCSDLPFNGNADAVVEIISGSTAGSKVIKVTLTSGNRSPYHWEYTYWDGGTNVSGWIGFQPQLTAGAGITISSNNVISATGGGGGSIPTVTWYTSADWTISSDNKTLTITDTTSANLVKIYKNGALLQSGSTNDYTLSGSSVVFTSELGTNDKITVEIF